LVAISFAGLLINAYLYGGSGYESLEEIMKAPLFQKGFWVILFAASITSAGFFHVFAVIAGKRAFKQIVKNGQDAEAKILVLHDTGTRINDDPVVKISLEVLPQNLPSFVREVKQTVSVLHLPILQPGKLVRVKYIPGTEKVAIVGAKQG
jgi:hypothetical protein